MSRLLPCLCAAVLFSACAGASVKPSGDAERSKAAFVEMAKVMSGPRCLNCHVEGDSPTQGDAMALHQPPVVRGPTGMGVPGMRCSTCHSETNVTLLDHEGSVPGAPSWQLPPASMAWQGKTAREICEQLKDPARNDGISLEEVWKRNDSDPVTAWAWAPGAGRTQAPGTQAELAKHTRVWIDNGAHCPN